MDYYYALPSVCLWKTWMCPWSFEIQLLHLMAFFQSKAKFGNPREFQWSNAALEGFKEILYIRKRIQYYLQHTKCNSQIDNDSYSIPWVPHTFCSNSVGWMKLMFMSSCIHRNHALPQLIWINQLIIVALHRIHRVRKLM